MIIPTAMIIIRGVSGFADLFCKVFLISSKFSQPHFSPNSFSRKHFNEKSFVAIKLYTATVVIL